MKQAEDFERKSTNMEWEPMFCQILWIKEEN